MQMEKEAQHEREALASDEIDIGSLFSTLWNYRAIFVIVLTTAFLLSAGFIVWVKIAPVSQPATVQFQLEFKNAQEGLYPNGSQFDSKDLLLAPNLKQVYEQHELDTVMTFEEFQNSLMIQRHDSARFLNRVQNLQSNLDEKLSLVERERITADIEKLMADYKPIDYKLFFFYPSDLLPKTQAFQILDDILAAWAQDATLRMNVLQYRVPVLSANYIDRDSIDEEDYFITLDILRLKLRQLLQTVGSIKQLPGAELVRTADNNNSLRELELRINELVNFKIDPLVGIVRTTGITRNAPMVKVFLDNKILQLTLEKEALEATSEIYSESLQTYAQDISPNSLSNRQAGELGSELGKMQQDWPTMIPQIGESFIDVIVNLAGRSQDQKFRQEMVIERIGYAKEITELDQDLKYYELLKAAFFGDKQTQFDSSDFPADFDFKLFFENRFKEVVEKILFYVAEINEIYHIISEANLNPQKGLFSISLAPRIETTYLVSMKKAGVLSILFIGASMFLTMIGVFIHAAVRARKE